MKKRKKASTTPDAPEASGAPLEGTTASETHAGTDGIFAIAAECTVADADALKSELAKLVENPEAVTLDISAVRRIDTAGMQLLAAFVVERFANGRMVRWQGSAQALTNAAQLLGLQSLLRLPEPAASGV